MAAIISARSPVRLRGLSSASLPKMATASGARSSRPVAYRLDASTWAIRSAALVSSLSSRRYQGEDTSASLTWRHARRQRVDVPKRPGRIDVAEGLEPGPGLGRRQPRRLGRQPGHRVEQRPVEQLLVQPPDLPGVTAPLLVEVGRRVGADTGYRGREPRLVRPVIESHRPPQPAKYGGILRQG